VELCLLLALAAMASGCRQRRLGVEGNGVPGGGSVPSAPTLVFEAPAGGEADVARLRAMAPERIGLLTAVVGLRDGGAPIHVVLAPEGHPLARRVPLTIAGYAVAERSLVVLLPERVPRYPYDSIEVLLLHEVTHVLASRAASGRELPRWWTEGLALLASRRWSLEDRSRLVVAAVTEVPADFTALEAAFDGSPAQVASAYALAGALVRDLVERHGRELVPATLARVSEGEDFETAFAAVAGVPLAQDAAALWRRYRLWYRWLPVLTSGATLWVAITGLALLAGVRRRQRDAALRRRWDDEERRERSGLPDRGAPGDR
jgi:hypothetical protein